MMIGRNLKEVVTLLAQAVLIVVALTAVRLPVPSPRPAGRAAAPPGTVFGLGLGGLTFALAIAATRRE